MGIVGPALATTIGYSGQLRDANGGVLPESQRNPEIWFRLYSDPTGGTALWGVHKKVVLNAEGLFSTDLSEDDTKLDGVKETLQNVLGKYPTLYIGLSPNTENNEIMPRQRILDTPRAAVATTAKAGSDGFTVSGTATITTLQADKIKQSAKDDKGNVNYYELLPRGTIVMWNGDIGKIPDGWALCDGGTYTAADGTQVTTPNMSGRFPVCIGKSEDGDADYAHGNSGGAQSVKLSMNQMPHHYHGIYAMLVGKRPVPVVSESAFGLSYDDNPHTSTEGAGGINGGTDVEHHENRPPYFALAFIMKL